MKKIITILEDDADIGYLLRYILEGEGFEIKMFSRYEGVQQLIEPLPDMIILDERLPGTNGNEVCREIKSVGSLSKIPVFLISAVANLQNLVTSCGADGHICKPFDVEELIMTIHSALGSNH